MSNWKDKLTGLTPYEPGEQKKDANIIKLNANENPYPPSPAVGEAILRFEYEDLKKYPPLGDNPLRSVIAQYYNLNTENVLTGNSSDEILAMCFRAFFNSKLPVLFPDITYSFYPVWCSFYGAEYEDIPLAGQFQIRISDYGFENGGIIIPNPNAPTGILMSLDDIRSLMEMNRDSVVIIDEAYADFGDVSAVGLINEYENILIVRTVSKSRSLAGLRVGYAIGNRILIKALDAAMNSFNAYPLSSLSIAAAAASFEDEMYFKKTVANIKATRDRVGNQLMQRGFVLTESHANFLFITHEKINAEYLYEYMFKRGILIRYFNKGKLRDYLRVSVGTDDEMDKFIIALDDFMEKENVV